MGITEHLRGRGAPALVLLLDARPDLASPPPASLRSLAARATSRASTERALAGLDARALQVLEAVLALDSTATHPGVTVAEVAAAAGGPVADVEAAVRTLTDQALLWAGGDATGSTGAARVHAAPGVDQLLGPHPAGLGPPLAVTLARRTRAALDRLAEDLGVTAPADTSSADLAADLARHLAAPSTVRSLLDAAPPAARRVLDALSWGPPVGRSPDLSAGPASPARSAVRWLLANGLLATSDAQHVVLPREVALALRDGATHREPALPPRPVPAAPGRQTVDADAARHAEEAVRLTAALVTLWGRERPPLLRAGGLGVRELRRAATHLGMRQATAALVVEVAAAAALVADDGEEVADDGEEVPALAPTTSADDWLAAPLAERWQALAAAWLVCDRAAWLVGTRSETGSLRAPLDPELRRPWAPRLRRSVLTVLRDAGTAPAPGALTSEQVLDVLRWRRPRAVPAEHAVEAVLTEATWLGVVGAGALSPAGRALLDGDDAAAALDAQLPPAVGHVLLQGDLTGVVPGRPEPDLAGLLEACAQVESRGAAVTVRFTEASVRSALDAGYSAEDLLAALSRHAAAGVPQPLEYLVLDVARRHGRLRVGAAGSYLRAEDPTLLAGLTTDRSLHGLGLVQIAPTVLAAQVPPAALLDALRRRGLAPVAEGPDGHVLAARDTVRRVRVRRSLAGAPTARPEADGAHDRRLHRLAADLLSGDVDPAAAVVPAAGVAGGGGTPDPVLALEVLREAAAEGRQVWVDVVGPDGSAARRRVRPLRVDAGRVRILDVDRQAELTVAVHRIAGVTPT